MEIVWTKQAQNSYLNNIVYLEKFWKKKRSLILKMKFLKL